MESYGYYDSHKKSIELLSNTVAAIKTENALTDEMSVVKSQAEIAIYKECNDTKCIMDAYNAYEKWLRETDWFRYKIQHAMVCLNINGKLASGTKMIIENKIGKEDLIFQ